MKEKNLSIPYHFKKNQNEMKKKEDEEEKNEKNPNEEYEKIDFKISTNATKKDVLKIKNRNYAIKNQIKLFFRLLQLFFKYQKRRMI